MPSKRNKRKQSDFEKKITNFLFLRKLAPDVVFSHLRNESSPAELTNYILRANPKDFFSRYTFGLLFPRQKTLFFNDRYYLSSCNISNYLAWNSAIFLRFEDELNNLLHLRSEAVRFLISGEIDELVNVLQFIENSYGLSIWLLNMQMLVAEESRGTEGNKALLSRWEGELENNPYLYITLDLLSTKIEKRLSRHNYERRINDLLEGFKERNSLSATFSYLLKQNFHIELYMLPHLTMMMGLCSLMDRFDCFVRGISDIALSNASISEMQKYINHLSLYFCDQRIKNLSSYFEKNNISTWCSIHSENVTTILYHYYTGNWKNCESACFAVIAENPDFIDLYPLYLCSLIMQNKPLVLLTEKKSIANNVLQNMYSVLQHAENSATAIEELHKTALVLDNSIYGQQLNRFCALQYQKNDTYCSLDYIHSYLGIPMYCYLCPPILCTIFLSKESLNRVTEKKPPSTGSIFEVLKKCNTDISELVLLSITVNELLACHSENTAIDFLQNARASFLSNGFVLSEIERQLFQCYLRSQRYLDAVQMVIEIFVSKSDTINRIDINSLIEKIHEDTINIGSGIEFAILFYIAKQDIVKQYTAYDSFLSEQGVRYPHELFPLTHIDPSRKILFLREVCSPEVLSRSIHFQNSQEVNDERIRICQYLLDLDPARYKKYISEINQITTTSIVKEGMRQLETGRVYIDENGLKESGKILFQENFTRYKSISSMTEIDLKGFADLAEQLKVRFVDEDTGELISMKVSDLKCASQATLIYPDTKFYLFAELFRDIRDSYLFSKEYGLDSYLSVRIRHGAIKNELRAVFGKLNLLLEKDSESGDFIKNSFWNEKYRFLLPGNLESIHKLLSDFTVAVDNTIQDIIRQKIQVSTEKKVSSGWFDYCYSDELLFELFRSEFAIINEYEPFINSILKHLFEKTKENLVLVRTALANEIQSLFTCSIKQLESEIRSSSFYGNVPELIQNITISSTQLQNKILAICKWFSFSSDDFAEFTLEKLIQIEQACMQNSYPQYDISFTYTGDTSVKIRGVYFVTFADIIRNIVSNAIEHCGLRDEKIHINATFNVCNNLLSIKFSNNISEDVRVKDPVAILREFHNDLSKEKIFRVIAKEGGSGLLKVRKLVWIDLGRSYHNIAFSYNCNNDFSIEISMNLEGLYE